MRIGFIGAGNMASAIVLGIAKNFSAEQMQCCLYDLEETKVDALISACGPDKVQKGACYDQVFTGADAILLAVKPYHIKDLIPQIRDLIQPGQLILSILAGISIHYMEEQLPNVAVIRVMPNTGAAVLCGVTGLVAGTSASAEQKNIAEQIFNAIGISMWIDDNQVDAFSAFSGSGGAYFYLLAQYMAEAGEKLGLNKEQTVKMARQTLLGVGKMLEAFPDKPVEQLRREITSPKGSTLAAVETYEAMHFDEMVYAAMARSTERGKEMGIENTGKAY